MQIPPNPHRPSYITHTPLLPCQSTADRSGGLGGDHNKHRRRGEKQARAGEKRRKAKEMGLTSQLSDVGSDSIPILLVVAAASWVSYLRSLLLCLFHPFTRTSATAATTAGSDSDRQQLGTPRIGSRLAGLLLLAEQMSCIRPFSYEAAGGGGEPAPDCVVCLCGLRSGEEVRRLGCCHVFHTECLDGWFDQMKLCCPLCRSPLVSEERVAEAERRVGEDLVAWLARY